MNGRRLQLRVVAPLLLMMLVSAAGPLLPKPWGFAGLAVVLAATLAWYLLPRNAWRSFQAPRGWTFSEADPAFAPPAGTALGKPAGEVRNVLRGELDGWPLVAWEEKVGAQFQWRCALDVGIDVPTWFARPVRELANLTEEVSFPDVFEFSPSMHPELKKAMARKPTSLAWRTSGTHLVAEVDQMSPRRLQKWLATEGRLLAELAAILRTELSTQQLRLASTPPPPAVTRGGPARNVWTPADVVADPVREPDAVPRAWAKPDFDTPSRETDGKHP